MDRPLTNLEDSLGLSDDDKTLMTIAMHTNTRKTNLLNVAQMKSYFKPILHAYTFGKHDDNSDIDGVYDYKNQIIKYFGKSVYTKLMTSNYYVVNFLNNRLQATVNNHRKQFSQKNNMPTKIITNAHYYFNFQPKIWYKYQNTIRKYFEELPKKVQVASNVLATETETLSFENNTMYTRLDILRFMNYFSKHPNIQFVPDPQASMADPLGIPDGLTPKECLKHTHEYFEQLSHNVPMTPKQVDIYCHLHVNHLNHQIRLVAKRHPRIHYKKYLSNFRYNLNYAPDFSIEGFNYIDQSDDNGVRLFKNNQNYHFVLHHLGELKAQYLRLDNQQRDAYAHNHMDCSFANDIINHHQLSDRDAVADYFKYTRVGQKFYQKLNSNN